MRSNKWLVILVGLLACGLLAAGCGGDEDESSTTEVTTEETATDVTIEEPTVTEPTTEETSTEETTAEEPASGGASPDDVYNACVDALEGTGAEEVALSSCEQARDSFEQCLEAEVAAGSETGVCEQAAEQAVKSLEASG